MRVSAVSRHRAQRVSPTAPASLLDYISRVVHCDRRGIRHAMGFDGTNERLAAGAWVAPMLLACGLLLAGCSSSSEQAAAASERESLSEAGGAAAANGPLDPAGSPAATASSNSLPADSPPTAANPPAAAGTAAVAPSPGGAGNAVGAADLSSAEYLGMRACVTCHSGIHGTYRHTGMGRAFYPMTDQVAVEDWSEDNEVLLASRGMRYRMTRRDGAFFQSLAVLDDAGAVVHEREYALRYAVGSNNHSRGYVVDIDGHLFQAPICWYPEAELWDYCPGFEYNDDHFGRAMTDDCAFCHNGVMRPIEGSVSRYEQPIVEGIGCERCHGPGSIHVDKWQSGESIPDGAADPTIVNPARLDVARRNDVCFQCHLGDAHATERVTRHRRDPREFVAGQPLTEVIMPFRYVQPTRHDFGLSAQADRMLRSTCYVESGGQLDCTTCHNPHVTVYASDRPADQFVRGCKSCHAVEDCVAPSETRQATTPLADDCVQCHMRKAEPDDQRYTEFTDHWIRRDPSVQERDYRQDPAIEPIFPAALQAVDRGEALWLEGRALYLMAQEARRSWGRPFYDRAEAKFKQAIEAGFDNRDAWFFLGKIYADERRLEEAVAAFQRALEHAPADEAAVVALAQTWMELNRADRARGILAALLERRPDRPIPLAELGRATWNLQDAEAALAALDRAVNAEPWNVEFQRNRGMVLAGLGRFDEAADVAERLAALDPDSLEVWFYYFNVMREARRPERQQFGRERWERLGGGRQVPTGAR